MLMMMMLAESWLLMKSKLLQWIGRHLQPHRQKNVKQINTTSHRWSIIIHCLKWYMVHGPGTRDRLSKRPQVSVKQTQPHQPPDNRQHLLEPSSSSSSSTAAALQNEFCDRLAVSQQHREWNKQYKKNRQKADRQIDGHTVQTDFFCSVRLRLR